MNKKTPNARNLPKHHMTSHKREEHGKQRTCAARLITAHGRKKANFLKINRQTKRKEHNYA